MKSNDQIIGIYLGAYKATLPGYNIVYQDINGKRDLPGDMLCIDNDLYTWLKAHGVPTSQSMRKRHEV